MAGVIGGWSTCDRRSPRSTVNRAVIGIQESSPLPDSSIRRQTTVSRIRQPNADWERPSGPPPPACPGSHATWRHGRCTVWRQPGPALSVGHGQDQPVARCAGLGVCFERPAGTDDGGVHATHAILHQCRGIVHGGFGIPGADDCEERLECRRVDSGFGRETAHPCGIIDLFRIRRIADFFGEVLALQPIFIQLAEFQTNPSQMGSLVDGILDLKPDSQIGLSPFPVANSRLRSRSIQVPLALGGLKVDQGGMMENGAEVVVFRERLPSALLMPLQYSCSFDGLVRPLKGPWLVHIPDHQPMHVGSHQLLAVRAEPDDVILALSAFQDEQFVSKGQFEHTHRFVATAGTQSLTVRAERNSHHRVRVPG